MPFNATMVRVGDAMYSGSLIVDGLSAYKRPVFVYILPNGELRGGAWVVLDPSINANGQMEMWVLFLCVL